MTTLRKGQSSGLLDAPDVDNGDGVDETEEEEGEAAEEEAKEELAAARARRRRRTMTSGPNAARISARSGPPDSPVCVCVCVCVCV